MQLIKESTLLRAFHIEVIRLVLDLIIVHTYIPIEILSMDGPGCSITLLCQHRVYQAVCTCSCTSTQPHLGDSLTIGSCVKDNPEPYLFLVRISF